MKGKNRDTGITLIALVVTIIILIILATISVNILFGENGIIEKAMSAIEIKKLAEEKEKIELAKATVAMSNRGKLPVNEYIEELITEGVTTQDNVKYNENGSVQVTTNMGRFLTLQTNEEGNVTGITDNGEADELAVNIKNVQLTAKTHTIKIDLEVEKGEGATYTYSYKLEGGEYVEDYSGEETSYTIEKLEDGTSYWVKVEATNDYGTVFTEVLTETKAIISGEDSVLDITRTGHYSDELAMLELYVASGAGGKVTPEAFVEALKEEGIQTPEGTKAKADISTNNNNNYEIIIEEKYVFEVIAVSSEDIEINYIGKVES